MNKGIKKLKQRLKKDWKKSKFEFIIDKFIGNNFSELGFFIIIIFGGFMIIERMIKFYIDFYSPVKAGIFTIMFMLAIISVPIYISKYMIDYFFKLTEEDKK